MAILTGDTCLVCAAICCDIGWWSHVTLDAIRTGQHRSVGGKRAHHKCNAQ